MACFCAKSWLYEDHFVDVQIMASLADVFKEKERSNWLKTWLAIDIAKSGLEHLADNEAQTFHQHIYSQVTSTLKSQSATCTSCNTTNLLRNQQCPNQICDKVCQEIIKEHRYKKMFLEQYICAIMANSLLGNSEMLHPNRWICWQDIDSRYRLQRRRQFYAELHTLW